MSANARDFLRRVSYWRYHGHELSDGHAFTMQCRIREDSAFLIGWLA